MTADNDLIDEFEGLSDAELKADYDFHQRREAFIQEVLEDGFKVVFPGPNELQIDIDSVEQYAAHERAMGIVRRNWPDLIAGVEEHPSKSGLPCRHVTVQLALPLEPWQRIALQAALGSDPVRELLSSLRVMRGDEHPTLFVEKP